MGKINFYPWIGFLLLGSSVYLFRNSHGSTLEFITSTIAVILFWAFHSMKFSFTQVRTLLLLLAGLAITFIILQDHLPFSSSEATTGIWQGLDINPALIGKLKTSHKRAFALNFDHRPTQEESYFKLGILPYTNDGLHYSHLKMELNEDLMPHAKKWARETLYSKSTQSKSRSIESWWRKDFRYSLSPGMITDSHALDQFLFDRKLGFCEHYAAALATLLKLSETEARVVVGFAGGSWNPILGQLTYELADAHAWVEVQNPSTHHWTVIDPTLWISPAENLVKFELSTAFSLSLLILTLGTIAVFIRSRKRDPLEDLLKKIERLEKKYRFNHLGQTVSERLNHLIQADPSQENALRMTLKLYLNHYFNQNPSPETMQQFYKSLSRW